MKNIHMRILDNKNFTEVNSKGVLQFKKEFTESQIKGNIFYRIGDTDRIIQINTDYDTIDCRLSDSYHIDYLHELDKNEMFKLIKNMIETVNNVFITGQDTFSENEFTENGIDKQGGWTKETYISHLKCEFDFVYDEMWHVAGKNKQEIDIDASSSIKIYKSGAAIFDYYGELENKEHIFEQALCTYGNLLKYFHCMDDLNLISMHEKGKTKHTLSDLHLLVDYIKEHKKEMPARLQTSLDGGMLNYLNDLGTKHENEIVYKK